MTTHAALRPGFADLIDLWAPVRQIGTGFQFTEGPVWHPRDHHLLFSDMPGDVRRRWDGRGVTEVMRPANKCNGMTYDAELNLLVCEHATSSLVRERPDGRREVVASQFEGMELNSPNDVCVKSDGAIYFSDPWYGRMPVYGVERPRQLGFQGVYRIPPGGGAPELLVDRYLFAQPNGLCFCPTEALLYVNDTVQHVIRVFDVRADGRLGPGRVFASGIVSPYEPGVPDGMKCDAEGNVWVCGPGGVWVYSPAGELIGQVRVPELVGNLAWGGADWRTLFLTATHSVYAVETKVGPRIEPFMRAAAGARANGGGGSGGAARPVSGVAPATVATSAVKKAAPGFRLDPSRCAVLIQDMQNDVVMDGGAFASSGSPAHCRQQNAIANAARLAEAARRRGIPVIHVWFVVEPGAPGVTMNCPLFEGLADANALVRGGWGVAPVPGLEARAGDHVVEKQRMSAWEGSRLETVLRALGRDVVIVTGAWTNMSIEHTARTGADKGYFMVVPEDACSTMNAEWHTASVNYALQNVAVVTDVDEVIAATGG
ncbi:isochorismatase family protein [Xanthobacter tagetidis]|uniref:Isochorismatase family protein n=1 Tax=Xanthobacter tagetidis TaxID=60216 RepID=A0A3L7AM61_9HYPH|nr:isochorismatase family protein [Xanthobacter tagetidis]MBB6307463.1 gluconolactonase [Xanthobacter tagetidis]RLP81045.1 isochorismatase family protein [Xanthobacter tagetidis]